MTGVDELVAFLRAALDRDEQVALAAHANVWTAEEAGRHDGEFVIVPDYTPSGVGVAFGPKNAEHIARWDPARVLAEVKADRAILDLHSPAASHYADGRYVRDDTGDPECEYCASLCHSRSGLGCGQPDAPWPCPTVSLLAQSYAGQDGWREEWRM